MKSELTDSNYIYFNKFFVVLIKEKDIHGTLKIKSKSIFISIRRV